MIKCEREWELQDSQEVGLEAVSYTHLTLPTMLMV